MAEQLNTIEWMIKFVGDRGRAHRADIIREGRKAGYNSSTLRHYLTSAAWFGHVAHEDCNTGHRYRRITRTEYFRRPTRGVYTLNERYIARYAGLALSKSTIARAQAYASGEDVTIVTSQAQLEDVFGLPVECKEPNTSNDRPDVLDCHVF